VQLLLSKFLPALLVSTIAILSCASTAQAEDLLPATLVIIDAGIDSSLPIFEGHLIHEVCLLDWYLCPNGLNSQEGPSSATVQADVMRFNRFDHGTQMGKRIPAPTGMLTPVEPPTYCEGVRPVS
jgi:hypothetical protein